MKKTTLAVILFLLVCSQEALAGQLYFGASGGWALGGRFSQYENSTCLSSVFGACTDELINVEGSGVDGEDSTAWGLKLGYSPTRFPLVSFEINYFQRNQRVQRQPFSASGPTPTSMFPVLPFNGQIEMEFESVKNLMFQALIRPKGEWIEKYLFNKFEPYVGAGVGFTFTKLGPVRIYDNLGNLVSANVEDDGGTGLAVLFTLGMNYKITESILLFGEYKWTWGFFGFQTLDNPGQTDINYRDHILMVGLTYRFNFDSDSSGNEKESAKTQWCQDPDTHVYSPC